MTLNDDIDPEGCARVQAIFCAGTALLYLSQAGAQLLRLFGVRHDAFPNDGASSMGLIYPLRGLLQRSTNSAYQSFGTQMTHEKRGQTIVFTGRCVLRNAPDSGREVPPKVFPRFVVDILHWT